MISEGYYFPLTTHQCTLWEQSEWWAVPTSRPGKPENIVVSGDNSSCLRRTVCRRRHQWNIWASYVPGVGILALKTMGQVTASFFSSVLQLTLLVLDRKQKGHFTLFLSLRFFFFPLKFSSFFLLFVCLGFVFVDVVIVVWFVRGFFVLFVCLCWCFWLGIAPSLHYLKCSTNVQSWCVFHAHMTSFIILCWFCFAYWLPLSGGRFLQEKLWAYLLSLIQRK